MAIVDLISPGGSSPSFQFARPDETSQLSPAELFPGAKPQVMLVDSRTPGASPSRSELRAWQSARLRHLLDQVDGRNPFWTARWRQAGVSCHDITSVDDLPRLPVVTKSEILADQRAQPPYGTNLTFAREAYSRLHQTSGTTGQPMRWLDTPESWGWILDCWRQLFGWMGLTSNDRMYFAFSFGPFLGFWAGFEGANRLGNLCIAGGGTSSEARLQALLDHEVTIVCCTPTYALRLAEVAREKGLDLPGSAVRGLLVAGEPGGNIPATRQLIEQAWGARVFDHWGMTELGPLAIECAEEPGTLRVLETECLAEVLNPQTLLPVADGEEGELVITNLGRVGSPLIRYRTGDRVRVAPAARGGQGFLRLEGGILGRVDDMVTIRGNNLYPSALEDVVRSVPGVAEFRIHLWDGLGLQRLELEIEPLAGLSPGEVSALSHRVEQLVRERFLFRAEVRTVGVGELPRFEMKARRFWRHPVTRGGGTPSG
jgi:phenylacetate-CoA ligase